MDHAFSWSSECIREWGWSGDDFPKKEAILCYGRVVV
jgi:hypothetical protein